MTYAAATPDPATTAFPVSHDWICGAHLRDLYRLANRAFEVASHAPYEAITDDGLQVDLSVISLGYEAATILSYIDAEYRSRMGEGLHGLSALVAEYVPEASPSNGGPESWIEGRHLEHWQAVA